MSLLAAYNVWLARARKNKRALAPFFCPSCYGELYTQRPPKGEVYDSLSVCPLCEVTFMKITDSNGTVDLDVISQS